MSSSPALNPHPFVSNKDPQNWEHVWDDSELRSCERSQPVLGWIYPIVLVILQLWGPAIFHFLTLFGLGPAMLAVNQVDCLYSSPIKLEEWWLGETRASFQPSHLYPLTFTLSTSILGNYVVCRVVAGVRSLNNETIVQFAIITCIYRMNQIICVEVLCNMLMW